MAVAEWTIPKSTRACAATSRELEVGETYYAALKEEGERFTRFDFSVEVWPERKDEEWFSFWKTKARSPEEEKKRRLVVDVERFYAVFASLDGRPERHSQVFRHLVALLLVRKRALRLDGTRTDENGECLIVWDRRANRSWEVAAPSATAAEWERAQSDLSRVFEYDSGDCVEP